MRTHLEHRELSLSSLRRQGEATKLYTQTGSVSLHITGDTLVLTIVTDDGLIERNFKEIFDDWRVSEPVLY